MSAPSTFLDFQLQLTPDQLAYTSCYCEENIWKLCETIRQKFPQLIDHCHVVFISNAPQRVVLGCQKLGDPHNDYCAVWDYHVILITKFIDDDKTIVTDFDTILPFHCDFQEYVGMVFDRNDLVPKKYQLMFRMIDAQEYLQTLSSDRSRMKDKNGHFFKPPPNYPCIQNGNCPNNLDDFISMDMAKFPIGKVLNLDQLRETFSK